MLRWIWANLGSLFLAFILALTAWVAAVLNEDPSVTRSIGVSIPIDYVGLAEGYLITGQVPKDGRITLRAPSSVWDDLDVNDVHLLVDLAGLGVGVHQLEVMPTVDIRPARVIDHEPHNVTVHVEVAASEEVEVQVASRGEPAPGHRVVDLIPTPERATVHGPASMVSKVEALKAEVSVEALFEDATQNVPLVAVDADGEPVEGVEVDPTRVQVVARIEKRGGVDLVSVVPEIEGDQELDEAGYRITDISVTPSLVLVVASDEEALSALSGAIRTVPFNVASLTGSVERRLALALPEGVSPVSDQSVLVEISIAPKQGFVNITRPVEAQGLGQGLYAEWRPKTVSIFLVGPVPTLNSLQEEDVHVVIDLLDLKVGTFQVKPEVIVSPTEVEYETVFPATLEVVITDKLQGSLSPTAIPVPAP